MVILREYKSVAFWLTFVSLWIIGYYPCCNKEDSFSKIENQEYFNWVTNYIKRSMKKQKKWTFFKITITPNNKETKISLDSIKDIVSEEYIHDENKGNVNNIDTWQNNIDENGNIMFRKFNKYNLNAFIVGCSDVNFTVGEMGGKANNDNIKKKNMNNNEKNNINDGKNNKEEDNKTYYYFFIKDITHRAKYMSLFSALEETAKNKNFSYSIEIIDANTTEVTDMSGMFNECRKLTEIKGLENWETKNVTDMSAMFYGCYNLKSLSGISKWNTGKVTNMSGMFFGCSSLKELPDKFKERRHEEVLYDL